MPHLQSLWSEVSKTRDDVVILCVNIGDEKDTIAKYWGDSEFTLRAARQNGGEVSEAFGVRAYPTNYVIGEDGNVLFRSVGWEEEAVMRPRPWWGSMRFSTGACHEMS